MMMGERNTLQCKRPRRVPAKLWALQSIVSAVAVANGWIFWADRLRTTTGLAAAIAVTVVGIAFPIWWYRRYRGVIRHGVSATAYVIGPATDNGLLLLYTHGGREYRNTFKIAGVLADALVPLGAVPILVDPRRPRWAILDEHACLAEAIKIAVTLPQRVPDGEQAQVESKSVQLPLSVTFALTAEDRVRASAELDAHFAAQGATLPISTHLKCLFPFCLFVGLAVWKWCLRPSTSGVHAIIGSAVLGLLFYAMLVFRFPLWGTRSAARRDDAEEAKLAKRLGLHATLRQTTVSITEAGIIVVDRHGRVALPWDRVVSMTCLPSYWEVRDAEGRRALVPNGAFVTADGAARFISEAYKRTVDADALVHRRSKKMR